MATERGIACYSFECQENPDNGRDTVYRFVFVTTSCKRGPSGLSHRFILLSPTLNIFPTCFNFLNQPFHLKTCRSNWDNQLYKEQHLRMSFEDVLQLINKVYEMMQVTLFTRGKAPITQQLPAESDTEYADFSSKVVNYGTSR